LVCLIKINKVSKLTNIAEKETSLSDVQNFFFMRLAVESEKLSK